MPDVLLTTKQLAERWNMTVGALENWRTAKKGPPWIKIGGGSRGSVRYRLDDIIEYEKQQQRDAARTHA